MGTRGAPPQTRIPGLRIPPEPPQSSGRRSSGSIALFHVTTSVIPSVPRDPWRDAAAGLAARAQDKAGCVLRPGTETLGAAELRGSRDPHTAARNRPGRAAVARPSPPGPAMTTRTLRLSARLALAAVWLAEGLLLKVLRMDPVELGLVADSGLWLGSPEATLVAIGWLEIAASVVLLVGYRERLAVAVTTAAMAAITAGVVWTDPTTLLAPLTGVFKNGALAVCALVVWTLADPRRTMELAPRRSPLIPVP